MPTGPLGRLRRIEWRLPVTIAALVLAVVVVFSWSAYREVHAAAIRNAGLRATDVAGRLAELLAASVEELRSDAVGAAATPTVVEALSRPSSGASDRLQAVLDSMVDSRAALRTVELWGPSGVLVAAGGEMEERGIRPTWAAGDSVRVGGFHPSDGETLYAVAAPVRDGDRVLGHLVQRMALRNSAEGVERIEGLVGSGATFKVGVPGGSWTDLTGTVLGPLPEAVEAGAPTRYEAGEEREVLGAGAPIPGAPWVAWVELPTSVVLQRPRTFLSWIVPLGVFLVVMGALAGAVSSRRIIRPLRDLTAAAGTVASGEERRRVPTGSGDELDELAGAFNLMAERVEEAHDRLEERVAERTAALQESEEALRRYAAELEAANRELEAFSYSVSHDLRAPLRAIHGFSQAVVEDHEDRLDAEGVSYLRRVCSAAERMGILIDDLLALSRATRSEMRPAPVDLSRLARRTASDLAAADPERDVEFRIAPDLIAHGDEKLLALVLGNLMGNAWKFTGDRERAAIEVGVSNGPRPSFFVRDDGAGFDMSYADKLFDPFQRLHTVQEFEGTGIGLALVQRIVHRHGGTVWGEGAVGEGATFHFTLPDPASPEGSVP